MDATEDWAPALASKYARGRPRGLQPELCSRAEGRPLRRHRVSRSLASCQGWPAQFRTLLPRPPGEKSLCTSSAAGTLSCFARTGRHKSVRSCNTRQQQAMISFNKEGARYGDFREHAGWLECRGRLDIVKLRMGYLKRQLRRRARKLLRTGAIILRFELPPILPPMCKSVA